MQQAQHECRSQHPASRAAHLRRSDRPAMGSTCNGVVKYYKSESGTRSVRISTPPLSCQYAAALPAYATPSSKQALCGANARCARGACMFCVPNREQLLPRAHPVLLGDAVQHEIEAMQPPELVVRVVGQQQVVVADPVEWRRRGTKPWEGTGELALRGSGTDPWRGRQWAAHNQPLLGSVAAQQPAGDVSTHLASRMEQDSCSSSYCTGKISSDCEWRGLGTQHLCSRRRGAWPLRSWAAC